VNWKTTLLICIAILLIAGGVLTVLFLTEPTAERTTATRRTAMLVEVAPVDAGTFLPWITAMGVVRPEQEILLSPRVSGEIVSLSETFTPGGFVEAGEVLLEIDPADYEAALLERESDLHQAEADLQMELGRQDVAKKDYELLDRELSSENRALVLREPQLNSARARVESARAALRRAELDLERTRIRAPFDAHILSRSANVGSQVSPGETLGHLVGVDAYWVEATVPVSSLSWIAFPGGDSTQGAAVEVRNRAAWRDDTSRSGTVHRMIGALEDQTRLARVLLTVQDPLAHEPENADQPPLMIGSFVEARIQGRPIENAIRMDRDYLRQNDTVWTKEDGVLRIRELDIIFRDKEYVYIRSGIGPDARVVTTNLSTVVDGAQLRLEGEAE
jgi:RND family efflux transporter MFP subunit